MMKWIRGVGALAAMGMAGCVSQAKYDQAVADATSAQQSLQYSIEQSIAHEEQNRGQIAGLKTDLEASQKKTETVEGQLSRLKLDSHNTNANLDAQIAANEELRAQLTRLGQNVDQLVADKNALAKSLEDARLRLEETRRTETGADAQAALSRDLASKLKPSIDAGELTLGARDGRVALQFPSEFLFSRQAKLRPAAAASLRKVAAALRTLPGHSFQVGGKSAAEVAAVVALLAKEGVTAETLSAAAYTQDARGERATGRRVDIMVLPAEGSAATPRSKS